MYSSVEVAKYLGIKHEVLLRWCDDYYNEFGTDDDYDIALEPHYYNTGAKYYMIGYSEISGFGAMMKNKRGLRFLKNIMDGDLSCKIDDFLQINTKLKKVIRDKMTVVRLKEGRMNDGKYYASITKLLYKKLGIDLPKGANPRDVLDKRSLVRLEDLEDEVADYIEKCAKDGMHYKDIYKAVKKHLEE